MKTKNNDMKWTISYKNKLIEGNSFNDLFNEIAKNRNLVSSLFAGNSYIGYREGKRLLECGRWYIENNRLFYQAVSKQFKNKDGDVA